MNKKYILYSFTTIFCMGNYQLFSMHTQILTISKIIGAGIALFPSWSNAYSLATKKPTIGYPMPKNVKEWAESVLEKCNDDNLKKLSLYCDDMNSSKSPWRTDYYSITAHRDVIKELQKNLAIVHSATHDNTISSEQLTKAKKIIAVHEHFLKHEAGHNNNQDKKRYIFYSIFSPSLVQAACFTGTKLTKSILKIQPPKTLLRTTALSCIAISSCIPKLIASACLLPDTVSFEKDADKFASDRADNILELEAVRDFWLETAQDSPLFPSFSNVETTLESFDKKPESTKQWLRAGNGREGGHAHYDPYHPTPLARAHFIQEQINKRQIL